MSPAEAGALGGLLLVAGFYIGRQWGWDSCREFFADLVHRLPEADAQMLFAHLNKAAELRAAGRTERK
jgi:hypothetical protein